MPASFCCAHLVCPLRTLQWVSTASSQVVVRGCAQVYRHKQRLGHYILVAHTPVVDFVGSTHGRDRAGPPCCTCPLTPPACSARFRHHFHALPAVRFRTEHLTAPRKALSHPAPCACCTRSGVLKGFGERCAGMRSVFSMRRAGACLAAEWRVSRWGFAGSIETPSRMAISREGVNRGCGARGL